MNAVCAHLSEQPWAIRLFDNLETKGRVRLQPSEKDMRDPNASMHPQVCPPA
jgi:hypothetical protein